MSVTATATAGASDRATATPPPPHDDEQQGPRPHQSFAAARAIARANYPKLFLSSLVLPRAKRSAARAVLAFAALAEQAFAGVLRDREHDDASHSMAGRCGEDSPEQRLQMLKDRLADIYAGRLDLPRPEFRTDQQHALDALARTARACEIPQQNFIDLAEGLCADLKTARYATWNALEKHCDLTAGSIARALACVCGMTHSDGAALATRLGVAVRFTRILCDVGSDARQRQRIYLPLEDLVRFGCGERNVREAPRADERFRAMMQFQVSRARRLLREANAGIGWLADDGSRVWAASIAVAQQALLGAIEARDYDVLSQRVGLSAGQVLRRLGDVWRLAAGAHATAGEIAESTEH